MPIFFNVFTFKYLFYLFLICFSIVYYIFFDIIYAYAYDFFLNYVIIIITLLFT